MPRTAELEVLLEKLNGSFFGFVADNELDQVRIRDVSADQLSRLVRNGLLNEKQALQVYLASMQSRHGIDFLMKLAVAALEKIRNGDNSHVDFHHDFAASKIIESLNLEPFLSTEKVGVETVQSRCPKCGEWHDYDLKPEAADGFGDDACYVVDCPDCEKTFGINCYGKVTRDWSVESRCPKCGERHDYDLHPSDGWPYPGGEAWFINCPSCQDYFGVSQDGKVVRQYNIRVACGHCDHGFLITEPAVDPFKIC